MANEGTEVGINEGLGTGDALAIGEDVGTVVGDTVALHCKDGAPENDDDTDGAVVGSVPLVPEGNGDGTVDGLTI